MLKDYCQASVIIDTIFRLVFKNVFTLIKGVQEAERGLAAIQMMGNGVIKNRALAMTGASESIIAYLTKLGVASASELTFAQKLKLSTLALWEQAKAWAASPLGMATIAATSIFAIVKLVDLLTTSLAESREKLADLKEEFSEIESELTTVNDELQTTIDRINELQGKDSLTFTEAEELENLKRQNVELERQIALLETLQKHNAREMNKTFVETMEKDLSDKKEHFVNDQYASDNYTPQFGTDLYYSSAGHTSATTMSEKDLLYSALVRRNELYDKLQKASEEDREEIQDGLDDIENYLFTKAKELANTSENISYISNPTTDDEKKVNEWLDFINDFNDKLMIATGQSKAKENALNRLIFGDFSDTTSGLKDLGKQGQVTAQHLTDSRYDEFIQKCIDLGIIADDSEGSLAFLASGFNLLSEAVGNTEGGVDNAKKELSGLSDSITNLQDAYKLLDKATEEMNNGGLTADTIKEISEEVDNLTDYLYVENGAIKLNTQAWLKYAQAKANSDIAIIQSTIRQLEEDNSLLERQKHGYEDAREYALGSAVDMWGTRIAQADTAIAENNEKIAENQKLLDIYNTLYADITAEHDAYTASLQNSVGTISILSELNTGFSKLSEAFNDVKDGGDFDWGTIVDDKFIDEFGGLGSAYDEFIRTIASSPNDIDACQSAFNNLAAAYVLNSKVLESVTENERGAVVAMLEQIGVANAAAVVDAHLARNKEYLRLTTGAFADMEYEEIMALYASCEAGSVTQQVLAQLAVEKLKCNENGIQTSSDIDQLIALASAAHASTESIANLTKAKALMAEADSYAAKASSAQSLPFASHVADSYSNKAAELMSQADEYINRDINYTAIDPNKFKVDYTGHSGPGSGSGSGSGSTSIESWFEKQLAEHQHLVAMEQETDAEYLAWLSKAYPQAYNEGIISLDDFYKYQEEVFKGLRELFMDSLSDVEHEISMRENYEGEGAKIIELYEGLIADIEREIATARARGLTDEDDYIQELQKKWQDYTGAITDLREDITDAAKSALGELIDYRIDMLKREAEEEKDALDKKLDNLKDFYDKQKELLQEQRDEEKYLDEQADKRKTVEDLQAEFEMLKHDDSAWAQKRKLEIQEELSAAQKDLDEFEKDHALELALDALDKVYNEQESQLQAEMDALEEKLNDPEALYNRALEDIRKNSENQLYYQMLMYNRQFGDGNDETVNELWEAAFGALSEYEKLFGSLYKDVKLGNETGVEDGNGWDDESISGTNPNNQTTAPGSDTSSSDKTPSETPADSTAKSPPKKGDSIQVKSSATHFSSKSGGVRMASFVPGGTYTVYETSGSEVLIGRDGVYTGWINQSDIVGYKSGTAYSVGGLAQFDEAGKGSEYIFESSDGNRYRMFGEGSKVLNAEATNFLYNFANSGDNFISKMLTSLFGLSGFGNISKPVQAIEIHSGDIIVHGNANERTVSEIRRAQRENLKFVIAEFNKLNK